MSLPSECASAQRYAQRDAYRAMRIAPLRRVQVRRKYALTYLILILWRSVAQAVYGARAGSAAIDAMPCCRCFAEVAAHVVADTRHRYCRCLPRLLTAFSVAAIAVASSAFLRRYDARRCSPRFRLSSPPSSPLIPPLTAFRAEAVFL